MFKRIFARTKGILMLFVGSIALLAIALMLDFKTFEQFNFYRDVDVWTHPILLFQLAMVVIVLLMLGQVIGLSVRYYFAFKKLDALFPNNEWERKDFKEKADYVDEKIRSDDRRRSAYLLRKPFYSDSAKRIKRNSSIPYEYRSPCVLWNQVYV